MITPDTTPHAQQPLSLDPVCAAALRCFVVNGFHGTSIRQIAAEANLSVPGIYHHYPSKSAILEQLCTISMDSLLSALHHTLRTEGTTIERFEHLVSCLIEFHAEYQDLAFVTYSEIRSLPPEARETHLRQRREVQALVTELVEQGVAEGVFGTAHPRPAARAITNICLGVAQWYRPDGSLSVDTTVEVVTEICRDTVAYAR